MTLLRNQRRGAVEHWRVPVDRFDAPDLAEHLAALQDAVTRAAGDPQLQAVVLQLGATRPATPPSGGPLADPAGSGPPDGIQGPYGHVLPRLAALPQVVIVAVDGTLGAAGLGLLCCADVGLCSDTSGFEAPLPAPGIGPLQAALNCRLGSAHAQAWSRAGESWTSAQAWRNGLVHESLPRASLDAAVRQSIDAYLRAGPRAVARSKSLMRQLEAGSRSSAPREPALRSLPAQALTHFEIVSHRRPRAEKRVLPWGERRR